MPELPEQLNSNFRRRGWKIRVPLWLLNLLIFAVLFHKGWKQEKWDWFWVVAFMLTALTGLGFEAWLKRSYRCPKCKQPLKKPRILERNEHKEYVYDCMVCSITWRTRTYVPD
jgi:predicted SprT family Zn-dependent metalloprotease